MATCGRGPVRRRQSGGCGLPRSPCSAVGRSAGTPSHRSGRSGLTARRAEAIGIVTRQGQDPIGGLVAEGDRARAAEGGIAHKGPRTPPEPLCRHPGTKPGSRSVRPVAAHEVPWRDGRRPTQAAAGRDCREVAGMRGKREEDAGDRRPASAETDRPEPAAPREGRRQEVRTEVGVARSRSRRSRNSGHKTALLTGRCPYVGTRAGNPINRLYSLIFFDASR